MVLLCLTTLMSSGSRVSSFDMGSPLTNILSQCYIKINVMGVLKGRCTSPVVWIWGSYLWCWFVPLGQDPKTGKVNLRAMTYSSLRV